MSYFSLLCSLVLFFPEEREIICAKLYFTFWISNVKIVVNFSGPKDMDGKILMCSQRLWEK